MKIGKPTFKPGTGEGLEAIALSDLPKPGPARKRPMGHIQEQYHAWVFKRGGHWFYKLKDGVFNERGFGSLREALEHLTNHLTGGKP
jgi:hypothetical protein